MCGHSAHLRHLGVSENARPEYSTLNSRILVVRTPKYCEIMSPKDGLLGPNSMMVVGELVFERGRGGGPKP